MAHDEATLSAARGGDQDAFASLLAPFKRELRAYCYRMAGSLHDADDLLQESLLRAWRGLPSFEGRAGLRTWLYKVTTNACLDALESKAGRLLPVDLGPAVAAGESVGAPRLEPIWLTPGPAELYDGWSEGVSPEARYSQRQSVTLAFLVALQLLPARQRVALLLRDVVGWQAQECAELLGITVAAVNSALQRARETIAARGGEEPLPPRSSDESALLSRYVRAWEGADINALVAVLHEDATLAMPPLPHWIAGAAAIGVSMQQMVFAPAGPGVFRCGPVFEANGQPALAVYQRDPQSGEMRAAAVHLLALGDGAIVSMMAFLDPALFPSFGLPATI